MARNGLCLKPLGSSPSLGCWRVGGDVFESALDRGWDGGAGGDVISLGYEPLFTRRVCQVDDLSLGGGVAVGALHCKRFLLRSDVQKLARLFTSDAIFRFVAATNIFNVVTTINTKFLLTKSRDIRP